MLIGSIAANTILKHVPPTSSLASFEAAIEASTQTGAASCESILQVLHEELEHFGHL